MMRRSSSGGAIIAWTVSRTSDRRARAALVVAVLGAAASFVLLLTGAPAAAVLVPASIGAAIALAIVPFPAADRLLALGLVATFPLLPPLGIPNLPLSAAVLLIAAGRLTFEERLSVPRRVLGALVAFWILLVVGTVIANWPPVSVIARSAVLLGLAAVASYVGALVWIDADRRMRWMEGLVLGLFVVTASAVAVFLLQYVMPIPEIVDRLAALLGYVRGEGAAIKFDTRSNWLIQGGGVTLRAVSPLVPGPTNVGGYIGVVGPLAAAYWMLARPSRFRTLAGLAVALAVTTGIITYSRSSWVSGVAAGAVAVLVVLLVDRVRSETLVSLRRRYASAAVVAVMAVTLGLVGLLTTGSQAAIERITDPAGDPSAQARLDNDVRTTGRLIADPIRGYGLGNWAGVTNEAAAAADPTATPYVHNAYLNFGGATGILGLLWVVAIVALILAAGVSLLRRRSLSGSPILGLVLVTVAVFTGVQFLFDDNLRNPQYASLLLWTLGGGVALADASRRR